MSKFGHNRIAHSVLLYRVTYTARFSLFLVLALLLSFLLQPIEQAFAYEVVEETEESVEKLEPVPAPQPPEPEPESLPEPEPEPVSEKVIETVFVEDEVVDENQENVVEELVDEVQLGDVSEVALEETVEEETTVTEPESETIAESEDEEVTVDDVAASSTPDVPEVEETEVASSTDPNSVDIVADEESADTATSTASDSVDENTETDNSSATGGSGGSGAEDEVAEEEGVLVEENDASDVATSTASSTENQTSETDEVEETVVGTNESVSNTDNDDSDTSSNNATSVDAIDTAIDVASTSATTTEPAEVVVTPTIAINNQNRHQFSVDDCISVGDGAFYCSKAEEAVDYEEDGVFSAPDADGDMEIYIRLSGEEQQITFNTVDDAAPYYDAKSERIVWHRLLNDRYQIISFDVNTGEEVILTGTGYNNMEPVAYGDMTLWQAWVGNGWEIMRHDGIETVQLTDNDVHDIAPHMRAGYIVWRTQFADGWKVAVYDEETHAIEYIETDSAGAVENPRFVLVFDSKDANGDTRTLGYDFKSGDTIALGSLPAELPEELPEPEQTGEERALIQVKPTTREGDEEDNDSVTFGSTPTTTPNSTVATSTGDIVITASTSTETVVIEPEVSQPEEEFIATPTTTPDVSHIPDIVIPSASSSEEITA